MRKVFPFVAVLLVYAFTPGLCEMAEIAVHFVDTGDLHASDEERHSEHGDSQGDEGECHTCFCHAPTAFVAAAEASSPGSLEPVEEPGNFGWTDGASDGVIRELYRPPIA